MSSSSFSLRHHFPCFPNISAYAKRIKSLYTAMICLFIGLCICLLTFKSNPIPSHVHEDAIVVEITIIDLDFKRPEKFGIFDRNPLKSRFRLKSNQTISNSNNNNEQEEYDEESNTNLLSCHWKIVGKVVNANYFYSRKFVDKMGLRFRDWNGTESEFLYYHDDRCRSPKQIPKVGEPESFLIFPHHQNNLEFIMILQEFMHLVRIKWIFLAFLPLFCIGSLALSSFRSFYTSFAALYYTNRLINNGGGRRKTGSCVICNRSVVTNVIKISNDNIYHLSCFVQSAGSAKNVDTPVIRDSCELIEWLVEQKSYPRLEWISSIDSCILHLRLKYLPQNNVLPIISLVVYNWPLYTSILKEFLLFICLIVYLSIAVIPVLEWKKQVTMLIVPIIVYLISYAIIVLGYRVTVFTSDPKDIYNDDDDEEDNDEDGATVFRDYTNNQRIILDFTEQDDASIEETALLHQTFLRFPGILQNVSFVSLESLRFSCNDWGFERKKDLLLASLSDLRLKNLNQRVMISIYSGRNSLCAPLLEHLVIRLAEIQEESRRLLFE